MIELIQAAALICQLNCSNAFNCQEVNLKSVKCRKEIIMLCGVNSRQLTKEPLDKCVVRMLDSLSK